MERCGLQYRARNSFEKAHAGEAPPRLQVIGFNVCAAPIKAAKTEKGLGSPATHLLSFAPPASLPKPPASSPRSALQQLLLSQSPPSTSSAGLLTPALSSPSPNQTLTRGLLHQPAISPPPSNQNWTSGFSKPLPQTPSAYQSNPSSGLLKSLLQSDNASSPIPANQSSLTSLFSSLDQSQCASSSSSSGNQCMRGGGSVSVNVQVINQHNSKPSKAPIKANYEAFFRSKQADNDKTQKINNAKEIKGRLITAKEVINELPHAATCKKSSRTAAQQINERPFGNDKSKKTSLFMFVVSSPAPEYHHLHHHGENKVSEDMDFLSACHLCRRHLGHGKDVFMYSGDKAFCSMECRYQQIVIDERKERCTPPVIRSGATQVYQHTSIAATTTTTHHPIMINKPHFINTAAAA